MSTITAPTKDVPSKSRNLVEMNWDPITRIVGSLGIFTKIDFDAAESCGVSQHVFHFSRIQHFHEGQRSARRPLHYQPHLRHLRRQSRHLRELRAEHGFRSQAAGHRGVDRQSRRGRRVHVRSQYFPGQSGRRGFLRADGEGNQSQGAGESGINSGTAFQRTRLPHHRRHHAGAQSRSPALFISKRCR